MNTELMVKLNKLAFKRSTPFCYGCYKDAPNGLCASCGSDDLMRKVAGSGVEWGTEWIVKEIVKSELTPVDITEEFDQMLYDVYGETTKLGWMEADTVQAIKDYSMNDYRMAKEEHENMLIEDGVLIELYGKVYNVESVEELVSEIDDEEMSA